MSRISATQWQIVDVFVGSCSARRIRYSSNRFRIKNIEEMTFRNKVFNKTASEHAHRELETMSEGLSNPSPHIAEVPYSNELHVSVNGWASLNDQDYNAVRKAIKNGQFRLMYRPNE